jgi:thymidylate synthase (FAD)
MDLVLLRHTPNPDHIVALAARRCYSSLAAGTIAEALDDAEVDRLIGLLRKRNHLSPFEHAVFTFSAGGVSRALSHQLVRHRMASYSQESQRYVEYTKRSELPFVCPPRVTANPEAKGIFDAAMNQTLQAYLQLVQMGVPPEDARYIFPNGIETKLVFSLNARSLFNFFEQRCCLKAQWEIRELARLMLIECRKAAPRLFETAGAPCRYKRFPYCRENDPKCPSYKLLEKPVAPAAASLPVVAPASSK